MLPQKIPGGECQDIIFPNEARRKCSLYEKHTAIVWTTLKKKKQQLSTDLAYTGFPEHEHPEQGGLPRATVVGLGAEGAERERQRLARVCKVCKCAVTVAAAGLCCRVVAIWS